MHVTKHLPSQGKNHPKGEREQCQTLTRTRNGKLGNLITHRASLRALRKVLAL